jgi:ribosomal protein S18 acetylase RimI-like enzyme
VKRRSRSKTHEHFCLRPAAAPDHAFLLGLYATTRATELARTGWNPYQREGFIRSQFQARSSDYAVRYPEAEHSIISVNQVDVGTWIVSRTSAEILLINIELMPAYRSRGLGSALLRQLLTEAKSKHLTVRLHVSDDNPAATRFYRRLGFTGTLVHAGYLRMEYRT